MKILLRATNWVGDVVISLPALRALRAHHAGDRIAVLARPWVAALYRLLPEVDEVLVEEPKGRHAGTRGRETLAAELREKGFDRAILLPRSFATAWTAFRAGIPERWGYRGDFRSPLLTHPVDLALRPGEHEVWKHLRLVAATGVPMPGVPDATWRVSEAVRRSARARLAEAGLPKGPFAAAHVASFAHEAKRWPEGRFAALFDRLARERGLPVVLLGSEAEAPMNARVAALASAASVVDLAGKTSLPEVLGVVAEAALFVGNDSGLAHLANAAGTPTTVVFGPTDPDATRPWDGPRPDGLPVRLRVARRRVPCAPCRFRRCPLDHACMTGVLVSDVLEP
ncbi:MAG: lipopolysaccharide heptosyltransferase II [Thermoanaerobaculia bacterium]